MNISDYIHFGRNKLPLFTQSEVAECGITCVSMIAYFHGYKTNMIAMRQKYPAGNQGITVKQIIAIGNDIGFNSRVLKLDLGQLSKIKQPAILHWNFNHFVVLRSVTKKGIVIHDPAKGKVNLTWNEVSDAFTGIAIELLPTSDFRAKDERVKLPIRAFLGRVDGLGASLMKIFAVACMLQLFLLAYPYHIRLVVDHGIGTSSSEFLWWCFWGFMLVVVLSTLAKVTRAYAIMFLDKSLSFQVKANIQKHLLNLPLGFFETRHVGDIKSRFEAFNEVQRMISRGFITAFVDGLLSITTLVIMFSYQPSLAIVSLIFMCLLYVSRYFFTIQENKHLEQLLNKQAKENSHFIETIRAIMPIKSFAKENNRLSSWMNLFADTINSSIKREKSMIAADILQSLIGKVEHLVIVLVGASLIIEQQFTLGMFLAFLAYRQQFSDSSQSLVESLSRFKVAGTYLRRMSDIVLHPTEDKSNQAAIPFTGGIKGGISLKGVSFRYSDSTPWIYKDLSFDIHAGESVVITGRSGLGKTTLLKIMIGLLPTKDGDVLIDGVSLKNISSQFYRHQIATVMQNDQLFNGSLVENITFFEPNPSMERVKEAAQGAAIWQDILAMPMGLHTQVGDLGSSLSGGQKQRILLARAFYTNPKVLFLDEATSHLDVDTEKSVNQFLKSRNITRISVAHRLETINAA